MNKFFAIGNLTRDPELSETSSGISVCRFSIAVRRRKTGEEEPQTDFFNVTAWRGLADTVARYCKKGNKIAITGSIQMRQYEANDGTKRTAVDVIAEEAEFLTPKQNDEAKGRETPKKPALEAFDDDSDIPF